MMLQSLRRPPGGFKVRVGLQLRWGAHSETFLIVRVGVGPKPYLSGDLSAADAGREGAGGKHFRS